MPECNSRVQKLPSANERLPRRIMQLHQHFSCMHTVIAGKELQQLQIFWLANSSKLLAICQLQYLTLTWDIQANQDFGSCIQKKSLTWAPVPYVGGRTKVRSPDPAI